MSDPRSEGRNRIGAVRLPKIAQAPNVPTRDLYGEDPAAGELNLTDPKALELLMVFRGITCPKTVLTFVRGIATAQGPD